MDVDDIINAHQVAALLGVCVETVRKRAASGDLPHIRLWGDTAGPLRFSRKELIAHLARHSRGTKSSVESCP